jgi:hypothetical protein
VAGPSRDTQGEKKVRAAEVAAALPERIEAAIRLLDEWAADDSGYDEDTWPKLRATLEEDRLSARSLFDG